MFTNILDHLSFLYFKKKNKKLTQSGGNCQVFETGCVTGQMKFHRETFCVRVCVWGGGVLFRDCFRLCPIFGRLRSDFKNKIFAVRIFFLFDILNLTLDLVFQCYDVSFSFNRLSISADRQRH